MTEQTSVHEIIRRAEQNYIHGTTKLGDYVDFQMHNTTEKINAYINSKHTTGEKDSLGRDKPFFNIITAAVNIWYRATDIDRKDILIKAGKFSNVTLAFIASILLQDWMKRQKFGVWLNQWGRTLAQYGSAVSKFVEKDGDLICSVVSWNRMICDPVDFYALPQIEKFYLTPAQLRKNKLYNKEVVESLIDSQSPRKTLQGAQIDTQSSFIELYEVHGKLPLALLKENPTDEDWENYRQQMHVVSFVQNKVNKEYDDFTLYKGKEAKNPYVLSHLIEEDGRTLSIGAVESLFDAQWMQNHTMKNMKDTLDLSSKLIFQTADASYINRNILTAIETGAIMIHKENQPLTQVNTYKADITALQNFSSQWKVLEREITSTSEAMRGTTPPSGTPYSSVALLTQQSASLFEVMLENKGLDLEHILRNLVIPHLKKKMDTTEEISAILSDYNIKRIDAMYIPKEAIKRYKQKANEMVLSGINPPRFNPIEAEDEIRREFSQFGNQRFFTPDELTWKEALKDLEWDVEVGITNEPADKQAVFTTLSTVLQSIASNPNILQDPNTKMLLGKILTATGIISPLELSETPPQLTAAVKAPELSSVGDNR